MNPFPTNVLVLGGTGFVGQQLCAQLAQERCHITVPTRHENQARALRVLPRLRVVQASVHEPSALADLVAGHDAVVNLIAILHGTQAQFRQVHVEFPARLAQACAARGVRRLVHVSALGAASDAPSMYLRSKAAGETALQAGFATACVLRPSVIFGEQDRFMNLFARLQKWLPVFPLAGAEARFQPVWVNDVAQAVVTALQRPGPLAPVYELAGPEMFSLAQLVRLAGIWAGVRHGLGRPVIALSPAMAQSQARLMEYLPGPRLMSRDNLASMQVDNVVSGLWPGLAQLGITAASLRAIGPVYLGSPRA